jgi:hypothetical protein
VPAERDLFRNWFALRLRLQDWPEMRSTEKRKIEARLKRKGLDSTMTTIVDNIDLDFVPMPFNFVITPRLSGVPMAEFFTSRDWARARADLKTQTDILALLLQGAQLLSAFAEKRIVHHDLHWGNLIIDKLAHEYPIPYLFPQRCVMNTRMRLSAFDFDQAYAESLHQHNSLLDDPDFCQGIGECNEYQKNFDWYTFCVYFYRALRAAKLDVPLVLGELLRDAHPENDGWMGRPCKCVKRSRRHHKECERCELKRAFLDAMPTPREIFVFYSKNADAKRVGLFL